MNKKIILQFSIALTLFLSGIFLFFSSLTHPLIANQLRISFLDVGQGDAILAEMPDGESLLVDGGPDAAVLEKLEQHLGAFNHKIDLMILTHPHLDHLAGLIEVLKRYEVKKVLITGAAHSTDQYIEFLRLINEKNIPLAIAKRGEEFHFGEATLEMLYPFKDLTNKNIPRDNIATGGGLNDTSVVALLSYQNKKVLLMGDASAEIEKKLLKNLPEVDILKVGHHGSKYSSSPEFLAKIKPRYSVISAGRNNKYHHPHYRALKNLSDSGTKIYRTDLNGDIEAVITAGGLSVTPSIQ